MVDFVQNLHPMEPFGALVFFGGNRLNCLREYGLSKITVHVWLETTSGYSAVVTGC